MSTRETKGPSLARFRVARSTPVSQTTSALAVVVALALFAVPTVFTTGTVQELTYLFIYMILAVMWNALAGYGGMVSVGQQAFFGFGAYATVWLAHHGMGAFVAMAVAPIAAAVLAAVVGLGVLHLKGGHFAVATWVVAAVFPIVARALPGIGAGGVTSFSEITNVAAADLRWAYVYWMTLGFLLLLLILLFLLLRLKSGAALQAIRDDEEAAASLGVRVMPIKYGIYVLAGFGAGGAGALYAAAYLSIQPDAIFGVQWSALMIFMVLIGGLGTFEPIVGAIIYFYMQQQFSHLQTAFFIGLGVVAVLFALFLPKGLWSLVADRLPAQMPVGYLLRPLKRRAAASEP